MNRRHALVVLVALYVSFLPALAQHVGNVAAGGSAGDIVGDIGGPWGGSQGCVFPPCWPWCFSIIIYETDGACAQRQVLMTVDVTHPSDLLSEDHDWELNVTCNTSGTPTLEIAFGICPGTSGLPGSCTLSVINDTSVDYGEVTVVGVHTFTPVPAAVPALPRWGPAVLGLGLLSAGVLFLLRRSTSRA